MRLLLSVNSREQLFDHLKVVNNCKTLNELAIKLKIPFKTFQNWRYGLHYIPDKIIPLNFINNLEILERKEENWGRVKGGKETYKVLIQKYGTQEIRKRQSNGGRNAIKNLRKKLKDFDIDISNIRFLEFYGALLGDGWLSKLKINSKSKILWLIGISGHRILDKEYHLYLQRISEDIFNRKGYVKERPKYNARELQIGHRALLEFLNRRLNFPIGLKKDLKLPKQIVELGFDYSRFVIRGLFDTDGSFFFDKTPVGRPYPIISIHMHAPVLLSQVREILVKEGFKPIMYHKGQEIKLKGSIQLRKWMDKVGSSNPKHLNKINALVAQLDSATAS